MSDNNIILESIEHRLELLNTSINKNHQIIWDKMDDLTKRVVTKEDCDSCQNRWRDGLNGKVGKGEFKAVVGTVAFLIAVTILMVNWQGIGQQISTLLGG